MVPKYWSTLDVSVPRHPVQLNLVGPKLVKPKRVLCWPICCGEFFSKIRKGPLKKVHHRTTHEKSGFLGNVDTTFMTIFALKKSTACFKKRKIQIWN